MDKKEEKEALKQDILNNLDELVDILYGQFGEDLMFTVKDEIANKELDDIADDIRCVMIDLERKEEFQGELDNVMGKIPFPENKINEDGSVEVYSEINIYENCEKNPWLNDIFISDYKYTYKKGDTYDDLPDSIRNLIGLYYESLNEDISDTKKVSAIRKSLTIAAFIGHLRYSGKVNSPYLLEKEMYKVGKTFMRNLDCLAEIMNGDKVMSDPKNNGLSLWDIYSTFSSKSLKFSRKK